MQSLNTHRKVSKKFQTHQFNIIIMNKKSIVVENGQIYGEFRYFEGIFTNSIKSDNELW